MAVYTDLQDEALRSFLKSYDLGTLKSYEGIAEGVENSNFRLETTKGEYILTLFEKRMNPEELPWFLGFMSHLAGEGITCPLPVEGRDGESLRNLAGRPAVIVTFLTGKSLTTYDASSCQEFGQMVARLHMAGQGYKPVRANTLSLQGWESLLARCTSDGHPKVDSLIEQAKSALSSLKRQWPQEGLLPYGHIHADLFQDNVFFQDGKLSGIIDFYFACTDFFAYDLAICLNAWCFDDHVVYRPDWAEALIRGYESIRPLSPKEREALPVLCQGAALRFLLTRLYDWINTPTGALVTRKDPWVYQRRLAFFLECRHV